MKYSIDEMISIWRERLGIEPALSDASIERFDGIDADTMLRRHIRDWQLALLDRGDPSMLCPEDITLDVGISRPATGVLRLLLPDSVRRVASIELADTHIGVRFIAKDHGDLPFLRRLLANPYARRALTSAIAVVDSRRQITVHAPIDSTAVATVTAYVDNGPSVIEVDESALTTIPNQTTL